VKVMIAETGASNSSHYCLALDTKCPKKVPPKAALERLAHTTVNEGCSPASPLQAVVSIARWTKSFAVGVILNFAKRHGDTVAVECFLSRLPALYPNPSCSRSDSLLDTAA